MSGRHINSIEWQSFGDLMSVIPAYQHIVAGAMVALRYGSSAACCFRQTSNSAVISGVHSRSISPGV